DLVVKGPRLPRVGETVSGGTFATFPGGKGANQAVAAARLGAQVTMLGRVGQDAFGRQLVNGLRREDIDVAHVSVDPGEATGVAERAAAALLERGPRVAVVKLGDRGAFYAAPDGRGHVPAAAVRAVDTTAAGDAFAAALGVALGEGRGIADAVSFATRVAG